VIPHGIDDVGLNRGFVHLNTSHDTSELACDSLAAWWERHGLSTQGDCAIMGNLLWIGHAIR
jgi:hypothetical protein